MFSVIDWYPQADSGEPAENLAMDEILFRGMGERPRLRVYRWGSPAISFGYFMRYRSVVDGLGGIGTPFLRRITGGGLVRHGSDVTVMLSVPRSEPVARLAASTSYSCIHSLIADVLRDLGVDTRLAHGVDGVRRQEPSAGECFANPVSDDLMSGEGVKVVGGAQRRAREGLLYQGSVQIPGFDCNLDEFGAALASALGHTVERLTIDRATMAQASALAQERYRSSAWLRRR